MYKHDKSIKILTLLEGTAYELHLMILHSLLSVVSSTAVKNAELKQDIFHGKLPLAPLTKNPQSSMVPLSPDYMLTAMLMGRSLQMSDNGKYGTKTYIHHTPYTIHHTPHTTHHTPLTIHHTPHTKHHTSHTIHHTPCTSHHTSCCTLFKDVKTYVKT